MTIYRANSAELAEINRTLELIQKSHSQQVSAVATAVKTASSGSAGSSSGLAPTTTTTIPTTSNLSALAGADQFIEILVDQNGSVLTDSNGYALLGVKVASTIITGADTSSIGVLNVT